MVVPSEAHVVVVGHGSSALPRGSPFGAYAGDATAAAAAATTAHGTSTDAHGGALTQASIEDAIARDGGARPFMGGTVTAAAAAAVAAAAAAAAAAVTAAAGVAAAVVEGRGR